MTDKNKLYEQLKVLRKNAYCPYSNFRVACIIELHNGTIIEGVNVESAAYSPSICAERTALAQLYTQGYNKNDVKVLGLYTDSDSIGSPCGVCRQVMIELLNEEQIILIYNQRKLVLETTVKALLPHAFDASKL